MHSFRKMTPTQIKTEADTVLIIVRHWGRVIDLFSECDCQPCTVRRVVWLGIARGYGDNVKDEGEDEEIGRAHV